MTPQDMALVHSAAFSQSRPWSAGEFSELMASKFTHVVGTKNAFALIQVIDTEAELLTIATHPSCQRRGLARQCMRDWQMRAAALGAKRAFLEVAADNQAALSLYAEFGYERCGLRKGYYTSRDGQKADAILMERPLLLR